MPTTEHGPASQPVRRKRVKRISTFNEEFDISLFVLIARKKWRWIAAIFLTSIIITILYLRYSEHVYEESTTIQIGAENTANKVLDNTNMLYQNNGDELEEAVELMRSRLFIENVFRVLPMQISYYTEGTFMNHELYPVAPYVAEPDSTFLQDMQEAKVYVRISSSSSGQVSFTKNGKTETIPFIADTWFSTPYGKLKIHISNYAEAETLQNSLKKDAYFFCINNYSQLAKNYSSLITIKLLNPDAKTLQISCSDYNDRKACDIANTIASEYIKFDVEKRSKSAQSVLSFIDEQLGIVYNRIKLTEGTLDTFQRKNNIAPNQEFATANLTRLGNIQDQITANDLQIKLMAYIQKQLDSKKDMDPMQLITLINQSDYAPSLKDNIMRLRQLLTQRQEALNELTPNNQNIIQVNGLIETEKKNILLSITDINSKLGTKKQDLEVQYNKIAAPYLSGTSNNNIEYMRLQRLFSIDEKYYDLLLAKKTEYEISKAGYVPQSQILENALPLWVVVSPKKSASFALGMIGAISVSLILLLIIYLFYNNLTSIEEIERLSESPAAVLGIVPLYTKEIPASQLIANHNPKSILAESFRSIRTNLQFISADTKGSKIISITSTISGEGKTFVSINLAAIIAYTGKKVIVLDLDMRKPRIHIALGLDNSKGMSTLLIGKYQLNDVIQRTETENLHVITAGPIPPNPSELLISNPMNELLETLKKTYDVVIIDNPPVGLVTDGIAMMQKADYPIYVMRANYSKREFIHFIDRLYFENHLNKLSIILNGVDFKQQPYGYGYYGYGHTYGQGDYYEA
jgi:tyrosine-protein kinase Etk/Wzc